MPYSILYKGDFPISEKFFFNKNEKMMKQTKFICFSIHFSLSNICISTWQFCHLDRKQKLCQLVFSLFSYMECHFNNTKRLSSLTQSLS